MSPDTLKAGASASVHRKRMQAVGRRDTDLEVKLRRALWSVGLRYRVNARVEGVRPDIVFRKTKVAIFVDGCFWHGCPRHYVAPVSNAEFWQSRLQRNTERDVKDSQQLGDAGWRVMRFWGCEVRKELSAAVNAVRETVRHPYGAGR